MTFSNNSSSIPPQYYNNIVSSNMVVKPKAVSLNSPMIDRVHKAKPGCSACGKKVM